MRYLLLILLWSAISLSGIAQVSVIGTRYVEINPTASSGLENVFVIENCADAKLSYPSANVSWYSFSVMGGGYAEPIQNVVTENNSSTISITAGDKGYIVNDNGRQLCYWVIDYSLHIPTIAGFSVNYEETHCDRVTFNSSGGFDRMLYYSINGAPTEINREIILSYKDLELIGDENAEASSYWGEYTKQVEFPYISAYFSTQTPLCDTEFHLSGDRFLRAWGEPVDYTSSFFVTPRVEAKTWAIQSQRNNDNESSSAGSGLGGSAPCDITFKALTTDAVMFREWQFSDSETFDDVEYRFNEDEITYTFQDARTTYVRFVCADASGICTYESDPYIVSVGESKLLCPNAFSPANQDGVNDEWKVSYSSIVSYECHIFNRWGKELFSSTNPAEGWNGRIGSKFVPSGVYFYVIKAVGSDGVKYNLKGDINVISSKISTSSTGNQD